MHFVQCRKCDGTWFDVALFNSSTAADGMVTNLNSIFGKSAADLDFIHPTRLTDGDYAVIWAGVVWCNDHSCSTRLCGGATTYESLYKYTGATVIKRVTQDDINKYGTDPWKIALKWANNIRYSVNGWNCSKGAVGASLVNDGRIFQIPRPSSSWDRANETWGATRYGYGECQPNFQTSTGEIFHTMDLVVAVPGNRKDEDRFRRNKWVRVEYAGKSAVARFADVCGCRDKVDLSRGLATYLGHPGSGNVILKRP